MPQRGASREKLPYFKTLELQIYGLSQSRYTRVERNTHGGFMRSPPVLPAVACPAALRKPRKEQHHVTS